VAGAATLLSCLRPKTLKWREELGSKPELSGQACKDNTNASTARWTAADALVSEVESHADELENIYLLQ
jgi:hypothetical protein